MSDLPNDTNEWLAQVHRARLAFETAVKSMVGMCEKEGVVSLEATLNEIEAECHRHGHNIRSRK